MVLDYDNLNEGAAQLLVLKTFNNFQLHVKMSKNTDIDLSLVSWFSAYVSMY